MMLLAAAALLSNHLFNLPPSMTDYCTVLYCSGRPDGGYRSYEGKMQNVARTNLRMH